MTPDELARGDFPRGDRLACLSIAVPVVVLVAALLARLTLRGRR